MLSSDKMSGPLRSIRMLRWFALSWTAMSIVACLLLTVYFPDQLYWLLAMGLALYFAVGVMQPRLMRHAYRLTDWALSPLGRLTSFCCLALVYYLFFAGYALVLKLMQRDLLCLKPADKSTSGWHKRQTAHRQERLYWQY